MFTDLSVVALVVAAAAVSVLAVVESARAPSVVSPNVKTVAQANTHRRPILELV
ncbi:hypothetical protein [Lactiplantibacillus pentosus]|uniref:hypothetical protein n=1 Tax=Lactiplantibacillus pentosus TaxID=1589 RepID=UPI001E549296|nr:hypothetical protein [Lactiplantibacillus pentosus]UZO87962.1 hypothetical protein HPK28_13415 [Lactiplantibacillus pentosus]WKF75359.1 hypothetical protein QYC20_13440 [Lactiplantibacillus pentosus]WKG37240.1 hypothetical protein QYC21_13425 [Lactiplantibacillus pentosus]